MVVVLHAGFRVKDFDEWKRGYDASREMRQATGEQSYQVFRHVDDPNVVTVLELEESAEKHRAFIQSPDLQARMKAAGIIEMGQFFYMEEVDRGLG